MKSFDPFSPNGAATSADTAIPSDAAAPSVDSRALERAPTEYTTLPGLLEYVTGHFDVPNALNLATAKGWRHYSHAAIGERVRALALGLVDRGLRPGETVGLIAPSSPEWLLIDLAIQIAGGVTVPIFNKISVESFSHEVRDSAVRFLFVGDPEEMPKAHEHVGKGVEIIGYGFSGRHRSLDELIERGEKLHGERPLLYRELCERVGPDDLATIIYTSGSTGLPKGVELSQAAMISQVRDAGARFPRDPQMDIALSILPLAHVFERTVSYFHFSSGIPVYFADDPKRVGEYLTTLRPTIVTVVPRVLEKVHAKIEETVEGYPRLKRKIAEAAMKRAEKRDAGGDRPSLLDAIYEKAVYSRMRSGLGGRLRYVISGSSKLDPRLARFFTNVGVPIYEGYGLTEAAPVITANGPGHRRLGTVGRPFASVEVRIAHDGEILARGPNVMLRYHGDPAATARVLDSEGWLHTGDLGSLDGEGYLSITGRKKELFKKSTGEYVPPAPIEHALEQIPYVEAAVIFADNRVYVTAILFPDMEKIARLKARSGLGEMTTEEFLASDFLHMKTQHHISAINRHRHHCEWIERFHIADHPATLESGELTPTLKVRRHVVEERYAKVIEEMYDSIGGTK